MKDFDRFWAIYQEAFPQNERRTRIDQELIMEHENYKIKLFCEGNQMIGFVAYWDLKDFLFIEHLAVEKSHRGKSYGGSMVSDIISSTKGLVILEVEQPGDEIAMKRIKFYNNLGFRLNDTNYVQPSYGIGKEPLPLLLMSYPNLIVDSKAGEIIKKIHGVVYNFVE